MPGRRTETTKLALIRSRLYCFYHYYCCRNRSSRRNVDYKSWGVRIYQLCFYLFDLSQITLLTYNKIYDLSILPDCTFRIYITNVKVSIKLSTVSAEKVFKRVWKYIGRNNIKQVTAAVVNVILYPRRRFSFVMSILTRVWCAAVISISSLGWI